MKRRPRPTRPRGRPPSRQLEQAGDHIRTNLRLWERQAKAYDRRFEKVLAGPSAMSWGFWRIPEATLQLLGPLRGRRILELGCGAARWSSALAGRAGRVVGLDLSTVQLARARSLSRRTSRGADLIRANAERLPFSDASFDIVFSDWGAMTFCDPFRTVPEAARVLDSGGRLVFATSSPFRAVAQDRRTDHLGHALRYDYFGLHRLDYAKEVNFTLPDSGWVRLFREAGLAVESLDEPCPPASRRSRYLSGAEERWARRWPLESIWVATKE